MIISERRINNSKLRPNEQTRMAFRSKRRHCLIIVNDALVGNRLDFIGRPQSKAGVPKARSIWSPLIGETPGHMRQGESRLQSKPSANQTRLRIDYERFDRSIVVNVV